MCENNSYSWTASTNLTNRCQLLLGSCQREGGLAKRMAEGLKVQPINALGDLLYFFSKVYGPKYFAGGPFTKTFF